MQIKTVRGFLLLSGAILYLTAIAKFISATGSAHVLNLPDPIVKITFQHLFWAVGTVEIIIASFCFFGKNIELQVGGVAWLATNFFGYRAALILVGYHKPCSCLGNLTDAIHIPPNTADNIMKILLAYLLFGSYTTLFCLWKKKQKSVLKSLSSENRSSAGL